MVAVVIRKGGKVSYSKMRKKVNGDVSKRNLNHLAEQSGLTKDGLVKGFNLPNKRMLTVEAADSD